MLLARHAATGGQSPQRWQRSASTLGTMSSQKPLPSGLTREFLQAGQNLLCMPVHLDPGPDGLYQSIWIDKVGNSI